MKKLAVLILLLSNSLAMATDWHCKNNEIEIYCASEECKVSDGFTPMDVSFNDKGNMSICAYTGCWEGVGEIFNSGNYVIVIGQHLQFKSAIKSDEMKDDFLIAIDTDDKFSVLKGHGYAMPMTCNTSTIKNR